MPTTALSKYAENQFLSTTVVRYSLMSEILADTLPRATAAIGGHPGFSTVMANLTAAANAWNSGETQIANTGAALPGASLAFDDKMASLTRKPDAETASVLETWDTTIRGQVVFRGSIYLALLPNGRETLTAGTREEQLDAIRDFGLRLTAQIGKPTLVTLGAAVASFSNAARALRTAQTNAKAALETARLLQEPRRLAAATALYALIAQGMLIWSANPAQVDTLWDVNILRRSPQRPRPASKLASALQSGGI